MNPDADNRAVSALFRAFGGRLRLTAADASQPASGRGLHRFETMALAALLAMVGGAAVCERLNAWCGPLWTVPLALPGLFVAFQATAFLLGPLARACAAACGSLEGWRWRLWATALGAWSAWAVQRGGWPAIFGWIWLGLLAANLAAVPVLVWRRLMRLRGWTGVITRIVLAVVCHLPFLWFLSQGSLWPAVASGAGVAALWCRGTLSARSQIFGPVIRRFNGRGVWLTIDDGPDPASTPALLDLLDAHRAQATFFVIGRKVRQHPELAREIVRRGHTLGNHTEHHPAANFWCAGPWRTEREIAKATHAITEATGTAPRWFRAPVGHRNFFTHPFTLAASMQVLGWNRRGFDGVSTDVDAILSRLLGRVADGDVLVIHDTTPVATDVLRGVLDGLAARGLNTLTDGLPDRRTQ